MFELYCTQEQLHVRVSFLLKCIYSTSALIIHSAGTGRSIAYSITLWSSIVAHHSV